MILGHGFDPEEADPAEARGEKGFAFLLETPPT